MQGTPTDQLSSLISERYEIVNSLLNLTLGQSEASLGEDLAVTMSLLARRESLVDRLRQIHSQLSDFQDETPESRVWSFPNQREQCQQLLDQSDEMLRKILELDEQTLRSLQNRREAVAAQLYCGQDSISVQKAYSTQQILSESLLDVTDL